MISDLYLYSMLKLQLIIIYLKAAYILLLQYVFMLKLHINH